MYKRTYILGLRVMCINTNAQRLKMRVKEDVMLHLYFINLIINQKK